MAKSSINYDEFNNRFEEHFEPILEMENDTSFLQN